MREEILQYNQHLLAVLGDQVSVKNIEVELNVIKRDPLPPFVVVGCHITASRCIVHLLQDDFLCRYLPPT